MASRLTRWLRDVPVEGRLERESAPAVQVLLLLLAILPMVVWLALRGGVGLASYDLPALSVTSLLALAVVRRGHLRASAAVIAAGFMATLGASLLADGLAARQSLLPLALVPLVIASLLVGRRALWLTLVAVLGIPAAAALRDVPGAWPTAAAALNPLTNTVLGSYALSALFLAAILDRFGTSLRQAYRRSVEQATLLEETNARLQAAESRFQATISGSLDAFLVLDAVRDEHGRVVDFVPIELNERAARLFGMARSALLGARLSAFRPEAFFDGGSFTTWARVVKSRETVELECAPVAPLGGMTWMRQQVVPVGDGVAVIIRDLSGQRAAEVAVSDLRAQFLQSQKMEVVGVLAGSVAHDFNNLLTVIGGHAELLAGDALPVESREGVEQILHATTRAVDLTRSLLAFSRKRGASPRVIRLRDVIHRSLAMWQRLVGFPVALHVELEDDHPVRLDEGEFDQVMLNLLVNARDAMPNGGRITLRLASAALPADLIRDDDSAGAIRHVMLEVADSGVGMDADTLSHIFEPFYTTKPTGRGTGLGLPTVRRLLTEQGGRITVESVVGAGTTFRLYWPQADAPLDDVVDETSTRQNPGSETIMFLDDDPGVRKLFESSLRAIGYRVLATESGSEACRLAETETIDLLIADLMLPDMHGAEVAARIRQRRGEVPVIFFTGSTEPLLTLEPSQRFLQKPVTPRELAKHVRAILDETRDVGAERRS